MKRIPLAMARVPDDLLRPVGNRETEPWYIPDPIAIKRLHAAALADIELRRSNVRRLRRLSAKAKPWIWQRPFATGRLRAGV